MVEKEYIEREALIRYAEKQEVIIKDGTSVADAMRIQGNVFRRCVETCPTADVVPKSEVERLIDDFQRTIRADAKVGMSAEEILMHINNMFAELKKKYTEGENGTK